MSVLKPRTATKVLYQGDDMSVLSELKRALDQADRALMVAEAQSGAAASRMGDETDEDLVAAREAKDAAQAAYDAGVDDAAKRAVEVELQTIGSRRFKDVVAAHPPREIDSEPDEDGKSQKVEHPEDAAFGVNTETFPRALLTYRDGKFRTIAQPDLSAAEVEEFVDDELAEGDIDDFWMAAFFLNRSPAADPKEFVASTNGSRGTAAT